MIWFVAAAFAQDAVTLEYVKKGQVGTARPAFTVITNTDAAELTVKGSCGGVGFSRSGPSAARDRKTWELDVPQGTHTCTGSLSVETTDGETGEMPLKFTVQMLPPMKMRLVPDSLDLPARTLSVTLERDASRVDLSIFGPGGKEIGGAMVPSSARGGEPIQVSWAQADGEALKMKLKGYDADGFYAELELNPWKYSIPHEDVVFATGSADIDAAEVPKLQAAMVEVDNTLAKYGKDVVIKLFVDGHTDTVGDAGSNQTLSLARAKSIASWFKRAGFKGDIYYAGLGERDLAVQTGDGVDEVKNRRAVYTLAATSPTLSGGVSWERL
jgi:outer membrane protein OmpA-like peptidoglycan-associated protein